MNSLTDDILPVVEEARRSGEVAVGKKALVLGSIISFYVDNQVALNHRVPAQYEGDEIRKADEYL